MRLATTFFTVACGTLTVTACTRDNPDTCTTADECATGQACDVAHNLCVPARLTFSDEGFTVTDDGTYWTAATEPIIAGTVDDPNATGIQLFVEGEAVGEPAAIVDGTWATTLPAGALDGVRLVTARIVAADTAVESSQWFGYEADGPRIVVSGRIVDERGDQVDFASGEPVHTHAGEQVALDAGCPDVYVHGYLTGTARPAYGLEVADNPLAITFRVDDMTALDRSSLAYRLSVDGVALTDWRAAPLGPITATSAEVPLVLTSDGVDGVPWLRDGDGELHVELRASDQGGHAAVATACLAYHALPAPLRFGAAVEATGAGTVDALFMNEGLLNLQNVLELINGTDPGGPQLLARLPVTQQTSEPAHLVVSLADVALKFERFVEDNYVITNPRGVVCHKAGGWAGAGTPVHNPASYCDGVGPDPGEPTLAPDEPIDAAVTGMLATPALTLQLVELVDGTPTVVPGCTQPDGSLACDVPARAIGTPPRTFEVRARIGAIPELSTTGSGTVAIQVPAVGALYLGRTPNATRTWCRTVEDVGGTWICQAQDMQLVHGLREVGLSTMTPLRFAPELAITADTLAISPLAAPELAASTSWSSGEVDVPPTGP